MVAILLIAVFVTAAISGIFGMAGGLMLMGVLAFIMPVPAAMVTHGLVQSVSNGSRALFLLRHVRWDVMGYYVIGAAAAVGALALAAFTPSRFMVFVLLGLLPGLLWIPKSWFEFDAAKPLHAVACGLGVTGMNVAAGVSGPLLDLFFVRTPLTRHEIVATKAASQVIAHGVKIAYYGAPMLAGASAAGLPPFWALAVAAPLAIAGTYAGTRVLDLFSDANFKKWTRLIVTGIGVIYLARAALLAL